MSSLIAFSDSGLVVLDARSSKLQRLTDFDDRSPAWSPDGTKIAFTRFGDAPPFPGDVWVINADGSGAVNLTNDPADDRDATWSPDGGRIAFSSDRGGHTDIWVMDADGTGAVNLSNDMTSEDSPSWSPDGTKIAFSADGDVWVMDADGSDLVDLTNEGDPSAHDDDPAWSPDGRRIAYMGPPDSLYVMNADGTGRRELSALGGTGPTWTPDGSKIVYGFCKLACQAFVINANGTGETSLPLDAVDDFRDPSVHPRFDSAALIALARHPASTSTPSPTEEPFPNEEEQFLLDHIPDSIAGSCERGDGPPGDLAAVDCSDPSGAAVDVSYFLYPTLDDVYAQFRAEIPGGIEGEDCSTGTAAEHPWYVSGQSKASGQVACFPIGAAGFVIEWTHDALRILSVARREDGNAGALYRFWLDAGPVS